MFAKLIPPTHIHTRARTHVPFFSVGILFVCVRRSRGKFPALFKKYAFRGETKFHSLGSIHVVQRSSQPFKPPEKNAAFQPLVPYLTHIFSSGEF